MHIEKVVITNFKSFRQKFTLELKNGLNILVGDNEAGKSTILEAIHLTLSGLSNGRYFKNDLSEHYFNASAVAEYLDSLNSGHPIQPPKITVELFFGGEFPLFQGDGNSIRRSASGVCMSIALSERYQEEYNDYVSEGTVNALPIEFYEINWDTFAREPVTPRKIPIKSALIDSSSSRYNNGSDVYMAHIIKNHLDQRQKNELTHAHRRLQGEFLLDDSVRRVNQSIGEITRKTQYDKHVALTVDLSSTNAWESGFLACVNEIPFHHIGKGEQAVIKTKLALEHKKSKEANIILLEEPENHLSHAKLNQLIKDIHDKCSEKQILISTHSSFVANKLGLDSLILIDNKLQVRLDDLSTDTQRFFEKIPGYDTLRMILCKKAILVEGDCDELLVQRAYMDRNRGRLPIQDGIDVISVGTSFLRFLQIAEKIKKPVRIVTDNDGRIEELRKKYERYLGDNKRPNIEICFDETVDQGALKINGSSFNYNTLEPKFVKANSVELLNKILELNKTEHDLHIYMKSNKTECALKIFDTREKINFPLYILNAIA
ncbi:ATP-dependent endonuclease [Pedobacter sp. PACM 27299]|uniref:ATP-dependent nuclease n=1 Tax=Pedobacter sp. PACM 27299 TaxID=1727164 RepID=UPI00070636AF|nr:AAA family ATPase [Pedobacter sp. PACM 27299]ALL06227.1 ATP-dependent endonuclease [Pedobacter sp. PACM 27299]